MAKQLELKKNDLQPYYFGKVTDSFGSAVNITGKTIYCTMKNLSTGTLKINRQNSGISITDGLNGLFEYHWQAGDTDTVGKYTIEFEVGPDKFTVPKRPNDAVVLILDSLDGQ